MAVFKKRKLSGSTDGKPIKVAQVATPGTAIHTAVAGTTAGTFDELWLFAYNSSANAEQLTIEMGGVGVPDNTIVCVLASKTGEQLIIPGLILQNALYVKAFASVANVITITGFVNAITDA